MKAVQASPNQVSYNTYVCGYCNKTAEKLQQCARCHFILYCDKNCQKTHWPEHKLVCQQKKYVQVAQDSAALILNKTTPDTLHYIYTTGLRSCVAIMAKGTHGIALVHDGGYLTEQSIKAVFKKLGTLEIWATAANPNVDAEFSKISPDTYRKVCDKAGGFYPTQIKRIRKIMNAIDAGAKFKQKKPEGSDYYNASETWVCMNRNGEIYTQNSELNQYMPLEETTFQLRETINIINSLLPRKELDCHLHFDGEKFTSIPQLLCDEEAIQLIALKNPIVAEYLEVYRKELNILLCKEALYASGTG